jgi:hypothetical protein
MEIIEKQKLESSLESVWHIWGWEEYQNVGERDGITKGQRKLVGKIEISIILIVEIGMVISWLYTYVNTYEIAVILQYP